jgi:spore photoproduct lyase
MHKTYPGYPLKRVYVDAVVKDHPQTNRIVARLGLPTTTVNAAERVFDAINSTPDPIRAGKEALFLTKNRGRFVRACPGTRNYECCQYQILHIGTYCPMDCAYCILQTFFHPPVLQYFVNHDDMRAELDLFFRTTAMRRIGTGEYTDSLVWADWTPVVEELVTIFGRQARVALELKTKTNRVASLQSLPHQGRTIVAWSLNSETAIRENEIGTATLQERLEAAAYCQSWGYPVAFHFDPIILYDDAEEEYADTIAQLFKRIDAEGIAWISLGTMRCMPPLKNVVQRRFPHSQIMYGELISGLDGKLRYFKPLRVRIYRVLSRLIRQWAPDVLQYFCMESEAVWEQVYGFRPEHRGQLAGMLDARAAKVCKLDRV